MNTWLVSALAFGLIGLTLPSAASAQQPDSGSKITGRAPAVLPVGESSAIEPPEDLVGNDIVRDIADDSGQFFSKSSDSFRVPAAEWPNVGGLAIRAKGVPEVPGGGSEIVTKPSR
jgi:hypothetical protein